MSTEQDSEGKGIQTLSFSESSSGDSNLVAAVSGQRVYILGIHLSANGGANTTQLQDTGGVIVRSPVWDIGDNATIEMHIAPKGRWWQRTAAGAGLDINLGSATAVSGILVYQQF